MNKIKYLKYFVFFCIIIYLINISLLIDEFPKFDDDDFILRAEAITKTGYPFFYSSESLSDSWFVPIHGNLSAGSLAFPLYEYSLALLYLIFGVSVLVTRLFGVIVSLFSLLLVILIIKEFFKHDKIGFKITAMIAASFYLINTFLINKSLTFSSDTTLLTFFMLFFCYIFIKTYNLKTNFKYFYLSLIFSLALISKFIFPPLIIFCFLCFFLINKDFKKFFMFILVGILGLLIACIVWGLNSVFSGLPFMYQFQFNVTNRFFEYTLLSLSALKRFSRVAYDIVMYSLPFVIIIFMAAISRIKKIIKKKKIYLFDFLLFYAIFVWFLFGLKAPALYYKMPLFPIFIIAFSIFIYKSNIIDIFFKKPFLYSTIILLLTLYYFIIPDIFLTLLIFFPITSNLIYNLFSILLYLIPILLVFLFISLINRKTALKQIILLSCLILIIPMNIGLDFKQSFADYSVISNYGEKGFEETVNYFKSHSSEDDIIISSSAISSFYTKHKKYYSIAFFTELDYNLGKKNNPDRIREVMLNNNITYLIYSNFYNQLTHGLHQTTKEILAENYYLDKQFGNYFIYKKEK